MVGAWSDRLGRRRPFILVGYLLWALATAAYPVAGWAGSVAAGVALVIGLDALMTAFGSAANDACFSAWVTDVTSTEVRGRVEGLLQAMPVLATAIGMGLSGLLIERFGYTFFFLALGALVLVTGLAGGLLVRDSAQPAGRPDSGQPGPGVAGLLLRVFRPAEVRARRDLYLVFGAMAVVGVAVQVTVPYEVIYLNQHLGLSKATAGLLTSTVAPVLLVLAVPVGWLTDRGHGYRVLVAGTVVAAAGGVYFAQTRSLVLLVVFGTAKSVVFLLAIVLVAWHRQLLPDQARGAYQGVRLVFAVMLPMLLGPALGAWLTRAYGQTTTLDGVVATVPPPLLYRVSAGVLLAGLVPVLLLRRARRRDGLGPPGSLG
ncbi:MAG: MFS transporter [Actinomycetia bacterium]|nr:MFS transporter [Actinomycetes bacterium]